MDEAKIFVDSYLSGLYLFLEPVYFQFPDVGFAHVFLVVVVQNGMMSHIFAHNATIFLENIDPSIHKYSTLLCC